MVTRHRPAGGRSGGVLLVLCPVPRLLLMPSWGLWGSFQLTEARCRPCPVAGGAEAHTEPRRAPRDTGTGRCPGS